MNKKHLITLAIEHDFKTEVEYFDYIIESEINGQNQQVKSLYNAMKPSDKQKFLNWLSESFKYHYVYKILKIIEVL